MRQVLFFLVMALIPNAFCLAEGQRVFPDLPIIEKATVSKWEAPMYSAVARKQGVCGLVEVALAISEFGTVDEAKIVRAQPSGYFEEAVLKSVRKWRFEPVKNEGVAIKYQTVAPIHFHLEGSGCNPNNSFKADK
jgi:TonB family protein